MVLGYLIKEMETEMKQLTNTRGKALVKAGILVAFIVLAISLIRFTQYIVI